MILVAFSGLPLHMLPRCDVGPLVSIHAVVMAVFGRIYDEKSLTVLQFHDQSWTSTSVIWQVSTTMQQKACSCPSDPTWHEFAMWPVNPHLWQDGVFIYPSLDNQQPVSLAVAEETLRWWSSFLAFFLSTRCGASRLGYASGNRSAISAMVIPAPWSSP